MTVAARFRAGFARPCARCRRLIKVDREVYRLTSGEHVCVSCARRAESEEVRR